MWICECNCWRWGRNSSLRASLPFPGTAETPEERRGTGFGGKENVDCMFQTKSQLIGCFIFESALFGLV